MMKVRKYIFFLDFILVLDAERLLDAEGPAEQEGEGDELYGNNFENDYRPIPHLDRYEGAIGTILLHVLRYRF